MNSRPNTERKYKPAANYHTDPTFIGMVKFWEEEGYCPFQLIDWFIDEGLDSQANAIRWIVGQTEGVVNPWNTGNHYSWWLIPEDKKRIDYIPEMVHGRIKHKCGTLYFSTFLKAIIALVDNWEDSSDSN